MCIVASAFKVQPAKAEETIYIRANGTIDPPTASISTADNFTYTLTGNIVSSGNGIIVERNNIIIDGNGDSLQGAGSGKGIGLTGNENVTIKNTKIKNYYYGVMLFSSSNYNIVFGNNLTANTGFGILLQHSSNNNISANNIANNENGILVYDSSDYNSISGNNITENTYYGIQLLISSNNDVHGNKIMENSRDGVWLNSSSDNSIYGNNITTNSPNGINLGNSLNNTIYHNNFEDNTQHVYSYHSTNIWDNGYPAGGNHWSSFAGNDLHRGQNQNEANHDGIIDTPYIINANDRDNYPLTKPYGGQHDIGITNVTTSKTAIKQNHTVSISIETVNYGTSTEAFNLTVYVDATVFATFTNVVLTSRNSTIMNCLWNTTGFAYDSYTVSAYAWPVEGETDTHDNTFAHPLVIITIFGDVNGDYKIDGKDVAIVAKAFNTKLGDLLWNPNADANDDEKVDGKDIAIVAKFIGAHYP